MASVAGLQIYADVQDDRARLDRAHEILRAAAARLGVETPDIDETGFVEFPVRPGQLENALNAVVPGWQGETIFYVP